MPNNLSRGFRIASLLGLLIAIAFPTALTAAEHFVSLTSSLTFVPANLQIEAGDKVTWTNTSPMIHTTTSGADCVANGLFDSGAMVQDAQFSYTFNSAGVYPYFCIPHCALFDMKGTVVVGASVPVENATWGAIKDLYSIEVDQ